MTGLHPDFLTKPLAHRGLHDRTKDAPENSCAAMAAAVTGGYGIELDLQLSKDGQAMVFHDYELERLTNETGAVAQRTAAELGQIKLLGTEEIIPTLAEVLALVNGLAPLLIEFKDQDGLMGPNTLALEAATAKLLQGYVGPVAVMSYNPHMVANMARLAPDICRGLVTSNLPSEDWETIPEKRLQDLRVISDFERVDASFISHNAKHFDNPRVAELKATGAPVLCWTIRSSDQEVRARKMADNITFEGYEPALSPR